MEKLSTLATRSLEEKSASFVSGHEYLLGLRGLLVIESFLWVFLQTFVPAAVKDATETSDGPLYQSILRKTLSVLFWNKNLLYSFFIMLSARTLCIPFLKNPSKTVVASAAFRRGLRLWFPTAVALAIVTLAFSQLGLGYVDEFKAATGNVAFETPYFLRSALVYFNSVFNLFWTTTDFSTQAGSIAFPSQTLWIVNVIYTQSYTVFMTMVIIPYTRNSWRVKGGIAFIIAAWWVQSWAWFTITGLLLGDSVIDMDFMAKAKGGIPLPFFRSTRIPSWVPSTVIMVAGLLMQYIWSAWRPDLENAEVHIHTGLYYGGELNAVINPGQPQARIDNYLFILGFLLLLESIDFMQMLFKNSLFLYLGKRSLSKFLCYLGPWPMGVATTGARSKAARIFRASFPIMHLGETLT